MTHLADIEPLLADVRRLHEAIRAGVAECLARAARDGRALASHPGGWGAGDITYALDEVADAPLADFVASVGARRPVRLVAEGPGVLSAAPDAAPGDGAPSSPGQAVAVLVDPIDGTRPLMHDMRPAWVLTGLAADRGVDTRLAHIEQAVMTELPVSGAARYQVLTARRGGGATLALHDVASGELLARRPLHVEAEVRADNGFLAFNRFLPVERPLVADVERRFYERAVPALELDPRLLYDDQYLCSAGQLVLLATGRYRLLADLRAWLGRCHGLATTAIKPYDMAAALVASEAGVPVLDAAGRPLDAPFDTDTDLDLVAYGNESLRRAFAPHLEAAMAQHAAAARGRPRE